MTNMPAIHELHMSNAPDVDNVPGPVSRSLINKQTEIETNAVAYPKDVPIAFEKARGATIQDVDGNIFLDFFAGIGVMNVGHANPYVLSGVQAQTEKLVHTLDFPTTPRLDLINKLDEIAPGDLSGNMKVIFGGPTGSDAIEGSIKLAKYNTGGRGLVAFRGGYHGSTSGASSLTAGKKFKADYTPLLPDVYHARYPNPFQQGKSAEEAVEESLEDVSSLFSDPYGGIANPAGIWVEPIQGEGGIVVPPEGFLPGLREIADEHNVPLIIDEIQTGFGRTGEMFASEHFDVTADAITMAKGIGGIGFPLSGMMYHEDLDTWDAGGHIGTFRGFLPAMVGGVRAIEYIQEKDLLKHSREIGSYIKTRLREAAEDSQYLADVRGKGLFIGAEFVTDDGDYNKEMVERVRTYCYEHGVLVWKAGRKSSVLRLMPPLVLTEDQAVAGMDIIIDAIDHATRIEQTS